MNNKFLKLGQLFFGVIVLAFFIYLFYHQAEVSKIPKLLLNLRWYVLLFIILLELLFIINRGQTYQILYNRSGLKFSLQESTKLFTASYALNILTPSAGLSGIALYMSQAKNQKTNKTKILLLNILFYQIDYLVISLMLIVSFIYLAIIHELKIYYIIGFSFLILFLSIFIFLVSIEAKYPKIFLWITNKAILFANFFLRIFKIKEIEKEKSVHFQDEFIKLKTIIIKDKTIFWYPFLLFILGNIYEIITIYLIFWTLGGAISIMNVVVGYSIGLLFMLVSITSSGIGFVEPIMALVFVSLGLPLEISVISVLIFRAVSFWLPIPFGVYFMKNYLVKEKIEQR